MDTAMSQVVVYDSELYEGYVPPLPPSSSTMSYAFQATGSNLSR